MKILVIFYDPNEVMDYTPEISDEEVKEWCFRVRKYDNMTAALMSYADTPCMWSRLLGENDDVQAFIDEAWEHIKAMDEEWLEHNFT